MLGEDFLDPLEWVLHTPFSILNSARTETYRTDFVVNDLARISDEPELRHGFHVALADLPLSERSKEGHKRSAGLIWPHFLHHRREIFRIKLFVPSLRRQ